MQDETRGNDTRTPAGIADQRRMLGRLPLAVTVATVIAAAAQMGSGWPDSVPVAGAPISTTPTAPAAAEVRPTPAVEPSLGPGRVGPDGAIVFATPTDEPPAALRRFYDQDVMWRRCDDGEPGDCALVTVPVDYAKPRGETIDLAMRRIPARDPEARKGTLFVNPGGPGGSGTEFAAAAKEWVPRDVREVWDVVGFDPRGIGDSGSFECLRASDLDEMYAADPDPATAAERNELERAARKRLAGCLSRGGDLAENMSSEIVARDLDVLRAVVGDTHLNYYGVSYGTVIGGLYADLFTSRVGLMVLDSAVGGDGYTDDDVTQAQVDRGSALDAGLFDETFAEYVRSCEEREQCPLGTDPDEAEDRLVSLLDDLEEEPLPTGIPSLPELTKGWAVAGLTEALLYPEDWEGVDYALDDALEYESGYGLAGLAMYVVGREEDGTYSDATFGSNGLPVICADWPGSGEQSLYPGDAVARRHPLWMTLYGSSPHPCLGWQGKTRDTLLIGAEPATPILVIGNERDAVTPIEGTEYMSGVLVRSRLVTVDAEGHGAYATGNDCADEIVDRYLVDAVPPQGGTACEAD